jgi:DNA repair exonuclease SbcCD ATPase subunit
MPDNLQGIENQELIETPVEGNQQTQVPPVVAVQPKVVTPDDLLKDPAVQALIEAARTQEKNKLYKVLGDKEQELKQVHSEITGLQDKLREKETSTLTETQLLQNQLSELIKEHTALKDSITAEREAAAREKREAELMAYKEKRIRETRDAGEDLILAIVKDGPSEEDIEASIEAAKEEYQKVLTKAETLLKGSKEDKPSAHTPRVTNPPAAQAGGLTKEGIKNMSYNEFAKNRDKLFELARLGQLD